MLTYPRSQQGLATPGRSAPQLGAEEVADVEVVGASLQEVGVENPSADGLTAILLHQTFLKKSSEVAFSTVGHFLKACPDGQGGPAPGPPW